MIGKARTGYEDHQPDAADTSTDQTQLVISNATTEADCSQCTAFAIGNPIQQTQSQISKVPHDAQTRKAGKKFVVTVVGLFLVILSGWSYFALSGVYGELRPHQYGINVEHLLLFSLFTGFCIAWLAISFLPDLIAIWRGTSLSMTWQSGDVINLFLFPLRMLEALICEPTGGDIRSQVLAGIVKRALADDNWRQKDWLVLMNIHKITAEDVEAEVRRARHRVDATEQK